jgi:hypothetical protein
MRRALLTALIATGLANPAATQDHGSCPMGAAHEPHGAAVDDRHDGVTGVGNAVSAHHFLLAQDGGRIQLEATSGDDAATRNLIRLHLQEIARAFAAGDFGMPTRIHDRVPPGVAVLKERRDRVRYAYSPTERGGSIRITATDAASLAAVHDFLRFQIADHETGDPTSVPTE